MAIDDKKGKTKHLHVAQHCTDLNHLPHNFLCWHKQRETLLQANEIHSSYLSLIEMNIPCKSLQFMNSNTLVNI